MNIKAENTDQYLALFPTAIQERLAILRKAIQEAAPEAQEVISYGMPAYKQQGILVYFAGYKNHIGFYPTGSGVSTFAEELTDYQCSKGTIQFQHDQAIPVELIKRIVQFRINENQLKAAMKKGKK